MTVPPAKQAIAAALDELRFGFISECAEDLADLAAELGLAAEAHDVIATAITARAAARILTSALQIIARLGEAEPDDREAA